MHFRRFIAHTISESQFLDFEDFWISMKMTVIPINIRFKEAKDNCISLPNSRIAMLPSLIYLLSEDV